MPRKHSNLKVNIVQPAEPFFLQAATAHFLDVMLAALSDQCAPLLSPHKHGELGQRSQSLAKNYVDQIQPKRSYRSHQVVCRGQSSEVPVV